MITHDLGVVAEVAERVIIMYAGRKVEETSARGVFTAAMHPYTRGLLGAAPRLGSSAPGAARRRLIESPGSAPDPRTPLPGCAYAPRCAHATAICHAAPPPLRSAGLGHWIACHHASLPDAA
jgi:peptide/nickel transport system ATP-binding protein